VQYPQPLNFLATFGAVLLHEGDQIFRFQRVLGRPPGQCRKFHRLPAILIQIRNGSGSMG